jgi:hypothetical protein
MLKDQNKKIIAMNGVAFAVNTIKALEAASLAAHRKPVILDSVKYDEQKLAVGGKRVFEALSSFGEMVMLGGEK